MEFDTKDTDIIQLLKKLKDSNGAYPQEMLASRRQGYLKQVAEISGAAGLAMGLRNTVKSGGGAGTSPAAGTLVEALLVIAIIAEAGAVAYFYRDKAAEFFRSLTNSPKVEVVSTEPVVPPSSPFPELEATPIPILTEIKTETATPVSTPSLEVAVNPTVQNEGDNSDTSNTTSTTNTTGGTAGSGGTNSSVSTPDPNGDNGNHYGQTPRPERTKEPGNDNSRENTDNQENSSDSRRNH